MGKFKQSNTGNRSSSSQAASGAGVKKKITKTNSFGSFASTKVQRKDKKLVNKELIVSTLTAEKKGNSFRDGLLNEKRRQLNELSGGSGSMKTMLHKAATQKKKRFDLDSDGENEDMPLRLTHKGKNLEDLDDFKDRMVGSSDEDNANVPAEIVDKLNFTGFEGKGVVPNGTAASNNPDRKKTKKEIYEEIIKKSKKMKYERQQQKEEDRDVLQSLNDGYSEIAQLLKFSSNNKWERNNEIDEFDRLARELQSESTTQANMVVKKVEDKKAKKLQEKRRKQLKGIMSSDGEEEKELNNDDELTSNSRKELAVIKHLRKVENLNKFIDQIKTVKDEAKLKKKAKKAGSDDDDDDDEEDGYDSLDEIDLDEVHDDDDDEEEDEDDDDDEMEHLELEDEFESEDEEEVQSSKKSKKAAPVVQKKADQSKGKKNAKIEEEEEEDDDEDEDDDEEEDDDDDEDESMESDEFENESD